MNSFNRSPKKWLSFEDQLDLLVERGLIIKNKKFALPYLESIGYYRLSGYWYPFKEKIATGKLLNKFISNSYFQDVLDLYIFDKRLRLLALDALERIEIAIRVDISYLLGEKESLAHTNSAKFDKSFQHEKWLSRYEELLNQSKKLEFIAHHNQYYGGRLPIWVATEIMDFGSLSKLYAGMKLKDKDKIARKYRLPSGKNLETQLHAFNIIRNISAHHGRLWNRNAISRVSLKGLNDSNLQKLSPNHMFLYFCLIKRMLNTICPRSTWGKRFIELIEEFPHPANKAISLNQFGLIKDIDLKSWKLWSKK